MSENLEIRAETLKLGRLLRRDAEELSYLAEIGAADLRALREQVTEVLFSSQGQVLKRLAQASRLLPTAVSAQMGERVFGPVICARITGLLDPDRAVDVALRLSVPFLADVACELDPRRSSDVLARIPVGQTTAITRELVSRGETVAMGRFVGYLPEASIRAAMGVMDPLTQLKVAFVLEDKAHVPQVVALLEPGRLEAMIDVAQSAGLEAEALELLELLSPAQRATVERSLASRERRTA